MEYKTFQPKITVLPEGGTVTTEYGKQRPQNAFYCAVDQWIYIAQDMLDVPSTDLPKARAILNLIIAHEYEHTIQGQSGVLVSGNVLAKSGSDSRAVEISRHLETQAGCFTETTMSPLWQGLKLTGVGRQDILNIIMDLDGDRLGERNNGDPNEEGDHGKGEDRHVWLEHRLNSNKSLDRYNTFAASSGEVE